MTDTYETVPDGDIVIKAYSEDSATRTELGTNNTVLWTEGDCISVVAAGETASDCFTLFDGEGTAAGSFRGQLSFPDKINVGFYPYVGGNSYLAGSDGADPLGGMIWGAGDSVPFKQLAVPGGFDPDAAIMAGLMDEDGCIHFKNMCAFFKLTVDFACSSIKIINNDGNRLASKCIMFSGFDDDGIPQNIAELSTTSDPDYVELVGDGDDPIAPGTYMIAVLPKKLSQGFTVELSSTLTGLTYKKSTDKEVTMKRGNILNIGAISLSDYSASGFSGSGTESDPYLITSYEKLYYLSFIFDSRERAESFRGKCFKQTVNIDCCGQTIGIGNLTTVRGATSIDTMCPFEGTYDGAGHTISNYRPKVVEESGESISSQHYYVGLFPYTLDANIKNLKVKPYTDSENIFFYASQMDTKYYFVSPLVGMCETRPYTTSMSYITNCQLIGGPYVVKGRHSSEDHAFDDCQSIIFGGLVAFAEEDITITDCTNAADITVDGGFETSFSGRRAASMGGILGEASDDGNSYDWELSVSNCRNSGALTFITENEEAFCGGIVGEVNDVGFGNYVTYMWNCVNSGNVLLCGGVEDAYAGGLIGFHNSDGYVDDNFGSIDPWIYNSLNRGDVESRGENASAGGIIGVGYDSDLVIAICVNTGTITATSSSRRGALCGVNTAMLSSFPAYPVGCYWSDSGMPIMAGSPEAGDEFDDEDYFDCYAYPTMLAPGSTETLLSPEHPNNRILQGWNASCTKWTKSEWLSKAAKWVYAGRYLDLDFTQRIGGNN